VLGKSVDSFQVRAVILLFLSCIGALCAERPNVIFILTDDQRRDSLPCYGNTFVKTPHLDKLAEEGVVFDNASVTSAICTPSRVSYFTGQYERRHGVNFNSGTAVSAQAWAKTYPVLMREAGYFTGYVGKNHVPVGPQGYKTGIMDKSFDYWYAGHGHIRFYPKEHHDIFKSAKSDTQPEIVDEAATDFLSADDFIDGAKSFLKKRDQSKPFCLSICFNVPHDSGSGSMKLRESDDELYRTTYRDRMQDIPLSEAYVERKDISEPKLPADVLFAEYRQKGYNYVDAPDPLRERQVRKYQTITGIDRVVGSIRKKLAELGVSESTIIVFSSDHGIMFGEHGLGGKALNYEPCLQVPLIVLDPTQKEAARKGGLVQSIDIAPTILDYAGVSIPETVQGKSLKPIVEGKVSKVRDFAFAENLWSNVFGNPRIESLKGARFKYIRYFKNTREPWEGIHGTKRQYHVTEKMQKMYVGFLSASVKGEKPVYEELFDLQEDPLEQKNLAGSADHQDTLTLFRQQCQAHVTIARGDYRQATGTDVLPPKS